MDAKPRRLRIKSNGPAACHVSIVDAETGQPLDGVIAATIHLREGTFNLVTLELEGVELDLEAEESST